MLFIGNTYKVGNEPHRTYDEVWNIMRFPTKGLRMEMDWHVELAPSRELFFDYKTLKDRNLWTKELFEDWYVPRYIEEIKHNGKAKKALNYLYLNSIQKDIILCCSCYDEELCHRWIVKNLVLETYVRRGILPEGIRPPKTTYYNMYLSKESLLLTKDSKGNIQR